LEFIQTENQIPAVPPAVEAEAVIKRYGDLLAVNQVALSVGPGEIYGLLGPNGAGKSTLMRMVTGISRPDSGRVLIHGVDVTRDGPAAKQQLGYLSEELVLYERLSGREYLELVAGLRDAEPLRIAEEIQFFELDEVADKWVGGYSLGMRKKLGLAAAFLTLPTVLVLDEPLNGLDVEMMRKLRFRLIHHGQSGRSAIISSHVMSFVERVCGRVGILRDGTLVAEGTPDELRQITGMNEEPFEDVFFALAIGPE
jgi:ABC-2 type transport system ATP-binding protein